MATGTAGDSGRVHNVQCVHYLRKTITFADAGTTVTVGTIPAGSLVLPELSGVYVTTAFNGDTTNTCDIGIVGATEKYSSDLALGTVGYIEQDVITGSSASVGLTTAAETIIATVVSTASASAGSAEVIFCYIPDNDG